MVNFTKSRQVEYTLVDTDNPETPQYRRNNETGEWEYISGLSWEIIGPDERLDRMLEELKQKTSASAPL